CRRFNSSIIATTIARLPLAGQRLEQFRNLEREDSNALIVALGVFLAIGRIEFEWRSVLFSKEIISKEIPHRSREGLLRFDGRLYNLEHTRSVAAHYPAILLSTFTEFACLARAPFRIEIAGRQDGNQGTRLP